MAIRAQLTQERSRQRREALLAAAIELFAEGGVRAVTHRGVANQAGLPAATTTYYFESIEELMREALQEHIRTWTEVLESLTAIDFDLDVKIRDATDLVNSVFDSRGPEDAGLELAIYIAASRDQQLRDTTKEALEAFEGLAARLLQSVGVTDPAGLSAAIVALIAGTALRRQSGQYPEAVEAQYLATGIRNLVAAHLLGDAAIEQKLADVAASREND